MDKDFMRFVMGGLSDSLEAMVNEGKERKRRTAKRSWPMNAQEKAIAKELKSIKDAGLAKTKELKQLVAKMESKKKQLFSIFEDRIEEYDLDLRYNDETSEIEDITEKDED